MTLEEMQDAIAAKTKPPRETVAAMFGGVVPSLAVLARRENAARVHGHQLGGGIKRPAPPEHYRTRQDACTSIARATQMARQIAMAQERIILIMAALETPKTVKIICGVTNIPVSSVQKLLDDMLADGKVSRVKHHHGAIWSLETS
jgi:hypothetical protein